MSLSVDSIVFKHDNVYKVFSETYDSHGKTPNYTDLFEKAILAGYDDSEFVATTSISWKPFKFDITSVVSDEEEKKIKAYVFKKFMSQLVIDRIKNKER